MALPIHTGLESHGPPNMVNAAGVKRVKQAKRFAQAPDPAAAC